MTIDSHALGIPRPPTSRGGDCRVIDIAGARTHNIHRFPFTTECRFTNGILRVEVGPAGAAPSLALGFRRGRVVVEDGYDDIHDDVYGGHVAVPEWVGLGTIILDDDSNPSLLGSVRTIKANPEVVVVKMAYTTDAAADEAFIMLRRGEPHLRIQHGSVRSPVGNRRVSWTPIPVGHTHPGLGRVEEVTPEFDGILRFIAAVDSTSLVDPWVNPAEVEVDPAWAVVAHGRRVACFGAGAGVHDPDSNPSSLHSQLGYVGQPRMVIS